MKVVEQFFQVLGTFGQRKAVRLRNGMCLLRAQVGQGLFVRFAQIS